MKKLNRIHIILIVVLLAVVAASAYFTFNRQTAEAQQPEIQNKIVEAMGQLKVAQEENDLDALKEHLKELQHIIDRAEPLFPEGPPSVQISSLILDSTHKLNLKLLKLTPNADAGTVTMENGSDGDESEASKYSRAEYDVEVEGYLGRINSLIGEIEGADFVTLTIEDMEISELEDEETSVEQWESQFTIVTLYQYSED